eukprot:3846345-Rhodomonas_salina.1
MVLIVRIAMAADRDSEDGDHGAGGPGGGGAAVCRQDDRALPREDARRPHPLPPPLHPTPSALFPPLSSAALLHAHASMGACCALLQLNNECAVCGGAQAKTREAELEGVKRRLELTTSVCDLSNHFRRLAQ